MSKAKSGDKVKVHYTGKLNNGEVFDSSDGKEPLEFVIGEHKIIPGFENGIIGMGKGDKKTINIPSDEAYGQYRDELRANVERGQFPPDISPEIGMQLKLETPEGQPIIVIITEIADENITIDANHPLAGQDLTFDVELVEVA
jgi:FKBP-type peptidyl-prolyl cis-trans isomerase 2